MRGRQFISTTMVFALAILASGCGTPREKTAPCKRPANLSSYATTGDECGPTMSVNTDRAAALAAIKDLASMEEE
ncbi:hypothetical protein [Mesorhizobium australicum]|uniref:Lipoprotein n=1 Tax=Mesorhizobium australicum TaxID=536018 RepID=A0A1X7MNZ2_9HYPH|nr:hypothetical protein [Mesorhizobium australicum]SMH26569.1 hypothetical protein SAMN02982922_0335 [Mesorhizobium australicum]